jgi:hypothetical protein
MVEQVNARVGEPNGNDNEDSHMEILFPACHGVTSVFVVGQLGAVPGVHRNSAQDEPQKVLRVPAEESLLTG